jgi:hypothetical protein
MGLCPLPGSGVSPEIPFFLHYQTKQAEKNSPLRKDERYEPVVPPLLSYAFQHNPTHAVNMY